MNDPSLSSHQRNTSDDVYLAALRRFIARVGHSRVPSGFVEDVVGDKVDLGAWVADIRVEYARASLDDRLVVAVETAAPDWSWDAWEVSFRTHVAALHQFADREGHANVPPFHQETIDGQRLGLGYWVSARHHEHRRHELPADRVAALEAVTGWEWEYSPESLDAETETTAIPASALYPSGLDRLSLRALRLFADREGHADVPQSHVEVFDVFSISLGAWVNELHVAYSRDELTPEQVVVLEAVPGWLWAFPPASLDIDAADEADLARWFKNDDDFRAWLDAHAAWIDSATSAEDAEVEVAAEPGLADELDIVIERPSKEDLDDELEDELRRSLDYSLSEHSGSDAEAAAMLAELAVFVEREGHADVPYEYWFVDAAGIERPLYQWVRNVREKFQHDTLSAELTTALDGIDGWVWPPKFDEWCKVLHDFGRGNPRGWAILHDVSPLLFSASGAKTLEEVGQSFDLSRERVRQLRNEAATGLYRNPAVAEAADKLVELLNPAIPWAALHEAFVADDIHITVLASVAVYAGPLRTPGKQASATVWGDSMRGDTAEFPHHWYGTGVRPDDWLRKAVPAATIASLPELEASFAETFPHADPQWTHWWLCSNPEFRVEGDVIFDVSGTLIEQIIVALQMRGEPMTTEELLVRFPPERERSVRGALINENLRGTRIVKTVDRRWALTEWDVARYVTGVDLIAEIITEHGGHVGLRKLKREAAQRSTISPDSIKMYATMHSRFVCEDDIVRLRRDDEPIATTPPERSGQVYRRVDAATPGCWSTVLDVDYGAIRAASTTLPAPFIALLGMSDGNPKSISCNNTDVEATINMLSVALSSSRGWRDVVTSLGAQDGDRVVFTALPNGDAAVTLAPDVSSPSENVNLIRSLIGGDGANGLLEDFAYAVGITEAAGDEFTFEELDERLSRRGTPDIRAALVAIHPELEA